MWRAFLKHFEQDVQARFQDEFQVDIEVVLVALAPLNILKIQAIFLHIFSF